MNDNLICFVCDNVRCYSIKSSVTGQTPLFQKGQSCLSCDPTVFLPLTATLSHQKQPCVALHLNTLCCALTHSHPPGFFHSGALSHGYIDGFSAVLSHKFPSSLLISKNRKSPHHYRLFSMCVVCRLYRVERYKQMDYRAFGWVIVRPIFSVC